MSEIVSNITLSPVTATFVIDNNAISVTPSVIDLNVYTNGGLGTPNALDANVSNVIITGGTNGQYLQTDGTGNLTWATGGGSGNGVVGGTNTQVQFNDGGNFGGNVGFTFNKTTGILSVPQANISNVVITGNGINTPGYYGDITGGNLFSAYYMNASISMGAPNVAANVLTANYIQGTTSIAFYSNVTSGYDISAVNLIGTTSVSSPGNITSSNGIGFSTGGTVTQITSRSTSVTLNKPTGQITLFTAILSANSSTSFVLNNTYIDDTDLVLVEHISGGTLGKYNITATPAAGSATITIRNNSASASANEQPVLKFMVFRAVNS